MGELLDANDSCQGDSYHERIVAAATPNVVCVEELVAAAAAAVAAKTAAEAKALESSMAADAGTICLEGEGITREQAAVVLRDDNTVDVVYRQDELLENRIERSNSCSQAEGDLARLSASFVARSGALGGVASPATAGISLSSVSHDNLASSSATQSSNNISDNVLFDSIIATNNSLSQTHAVVDGQQRNYIAQQQASLHDEPKDSNSNSNLSSSTLNATNLSIGQLSDISLLTAHTDTLLIDDLPATIEAVGDFSKPEANIQLETKSITASNSSGSNNSSSSSSSRFFSSKLNTGSLWSLLSVGSATSTCALNEIPSQGSDRMTTTTTTTTTTATTSGESANAGGGGGGKEHDKHESSMTSFFARQLQFATRRQQPSATCFDQQQHQQHQLASVSSSVAGAGAAAVAHDMQDKESKMKYRFSLKYFGSAMLHKNFTMPMLEWVVKDIRRQTNKSLNQRQFTIPIRDVVFEIQSNQLVAISCKDGHCIFVHPMHCVSKYAQLQHDSTCFSYIIRDTKDSPSFCHLFQAKSATKVHEIFNTIREVTTRAQFKQLTAAAAASAAPSQLLDQQQLSGTNRLQKSASTDGHWKSMLAPRIAHASPPQPSGLSKTPPNTSSTTSSASTFAQTSFQQQNSHQQPFMSSIAFKQQQQQQQQQAEVAATSSIKPASTSADPPPLSCAQFENSYQFEVMFVKRVKLQCRRVPPTFVDDALATLKTFEAPKAQIKGVTKRIISASVDERQEYDETCQSPGPGPGSNSNAPSRPSEPASSEANEQQQQVGEDGLRRGSSVSLKNSAPASVERERESKSCQQSPVKEGIDQASGKQESSARGSLPNDNDSKNSQAGALEGSAGGGSGGGGAEIKKHQSVDCLKSIDYTIKSAKSSQTPAYFNDFSPYNTITSSDLNERIAAIPVVSSSVSLDHETRQRLARQVRETIMATAATIKKDVYASGETLDSSGSSKVLDSLSCNVQSTVPPIGQDELMLACTHEDKQRTAAAAAAAAASIASASSREVSSESSKDSTSDRASDLTADQQPRRSSASAHLTLTQQKQQQHQTAVSNNFDLFRRASSRQVVKNRTMLLLIGKDELCAISIDKHQMLFSKSFNSVVHCLQGINNKDHFGLICRDSGKINPQTESYAGYVFKCQSDKVVREIMGALKQVIYSSQHNYHSHNSPYNPLNSVHQQQFVAAAAVVAKQKQQQRSPKLDRHQLAKSIDSTQTHQSPVLATTTASNAPLVAQTADTSTSGQATSLAKKRGFANPLELDEALRQQRAQSGVLKKGPPPSAPALNAYSNAFGALAATPLPPSQPAAKNPIKSMFCDDCPLYWFHRLCCDIESLPAEASKAIILRRIDSSLSEREQDDVYSKFSEFNIESIDEHNEIFMSILRQLCERKQMKHNQSQAHLSALAKSATLAKQQSSEQLKHTQQQQQQQQRQQHQKVSSTVSGGGSSAFHVVQRDPGEVQDPSCSASGGLTRSNSGGSSGGVGGPSCPSGAGGGTGHHRSGSSSGSLAFVIGQTSANQSLADASSAALDNFKRAKNSISVSIENMLKRRPSHEQLCIQQPDCTGSAEVGFRPLAGPIRSGSFKGGTRESRAATATGPRATDTDAYSDDCSSLANLRRSQSTSDYQQQQQQQQSSLMGATRQAGASWRDSFTRTINDDLTNPLVDFFKRRGSFARNEGSSSEQAGGDSQAKRSSTDNLTIIQAEPSPRHQQQQQQQYSQADQQHNQQSSRWIQPAKIVAGTSSPSSLLSGAFWKKSIFDKIHQPSANDSSTSDVAASNVGRAKMVQLENVSTQPKQRATATVQQQQQQQQQQPANKRRTKEELRALWKKAILEQITLLKMDKQNQKLQANSFECNIQRMKLNYRDVPYGKDASLLWDRLLKQDAFKKVQFVEVARLVRLGVPKQRRGEVWMFLMNQYQLRHGTSFQPATDSEFRGDANQTYRSLLSQLSTQQHEIFVDIGRTFPAHPYYSQYLSIGQLSLFNLLKAYSLLDKDVGYCQGLSFVAGILLLHVDSEDEAFELMRHLLFNFGLRKQYLPSMNALHLQLYQLTRLLRDHQFEIFDHFDKFDISPSLYAAPWFLTLFASQFPLGFVARLLDLIYLIGIEAIFRISLTLLAYHREFILKCSSLEATMEFMKRNLVEIDDKNMAKIFDDAIALDLRNKLIEYEIEYSFYCAEDKARGASSGGGSHYYLNHHHHALNSSRQSANSSSSTVYSDIRKPNQGPDMIDDDQFSNKTADIDLGKEETNDSNGLTSEVADATATVIIQHLLANNHLKSLRSNYSY